MRPQEIPEAARQAVRDRIRGHLAERSDVDFAYLHGSFLEGPFRDVDIAVHLTHAPADPADVLRFEVGLERVLGTLIGFPVDIRVLNHAPVAFRFNVLKRGERLFGIDAPGRVDYEAATLGEYFDFSWHLENYRREALGLEA